jgi:hypothetical protein
VAPKPPKAAKTPTVRKARKTKQAASQEPPQAPPEVDQAETSN